jgi:TRAP-type C4-dicarboxylate transport system substrate-binding protein
MKMVWRLALLVCAGMLAAGVAQAQRTLKINESLGPGSSEETALKAFQKSVDDGSKGQLRIAIHLSDALGNPQTSLENLSTGTLELYSGALEYYQPIVPQEIGVLAVPYVLRDYNHLRRYLMSPTFEPAKQKMLERGIRFISTEFNAERGPYRVLVSSKPVKSLEDLKGLRIRMYPNENAINAWRHLGTVPTVLPYTETYLAIRQGVVQGGPFPLSLLQSSRLTEVAKYVLRTDEFPQTWPMTVSERIWRGLKPDEQRLLVRAANDAGRLYAQEVNSRAQRDIDQMKKENGAEFSEVNLEPFRAHMRSFHDGLIKAGTVRKELYDAIVALGKQ